MKNFIALAISLLVPVVPVLADVTPDETKQAQVTATATDHLDKDSKALLSGQPETPVVPAVQASPAPAVVTTAPAKEDATKERVSRLNLGNDAPPAVKTEKPSFFAKLKGMKDKLMKGKIMGFVLKHTAITGAILGAMIGVVGGPAGMVVGACLGAVAADVAKYYLVK
jgi:hypothetical protein